MDVYMLLIPYTILIPISAARLFLLDHILDRLIEGNLGQGNKLNRLRALNIQWYEWLFRDVKDWAVLGILGGVTQSYLLRLIPQMSPGLLMILGVLLLVNTIVASILFIYARGYRIPDFLISGAVRLSIPDYVPANRKRVSGWGTAFILAGSAGFVVWIFTGNPSPLVWSFVTLTLGIFSFLRAIFPDKIDNMEVNLNAEKTG